MTQKRYTEIPKRQKCINKEEPYIGGAEDIVDDTLGKPQSEVNQERIEDIAAEVQRAQGAESTLDGKIGAEKSRAEGVEGGLNTRLQTVEQLAEISIDGGDAQIATGADFTNPDATKRAKVPTVGAIVDGLNDGIYDVSKRNPTGGPNSDGKFTLEYILSNANTLIPTGWRHGGMTISFVHTSDNNYEQYRCKTQSFSTNPNDWAFEGDDTLVENPEFVAVYLDKDIRIVKAVKPDGTELLAAGLEVHGNVETDGANIFAINSPEFKEVKLDKEGRILWGIQNDGNIYFGTGVPRQIIRYVGKSLSELPLDEKVDKEEGKSLIDADVADGVHYEENPEFICVELDANNNIIKAKKKDGTEYFAVGIDIAGVSVEYSIENPEFIGIFLDNKKHILMAFEKDGNVYYGIGVPKQVKDYVDNEVAKINDFFSGIDTTTLIEYLNDIYGKYQENPEYMNIELDGENKILGGRKSDGTKFENKGFETPEISVNGNTLYTIDDPEGRIEIDTDEENKVISYRDKEGVLHESAGIKTNSLILSDKGLSDFEKALKAHGFTGGQGDWSDYLSEDGDNPLHLPTPRCALMNLTNATNTAIWPNAKFLDLEYYVQFWDMQGNYFKKKVFANAQGNSSLGMPKKNLAIDLFDEDWDGDAFAVKFGNWVPQDSFHLKAYYADYFVGVCPIGYKFFDKITSTRGLFDNRDWKRALLPSKATIGIDCQALSDMDDKYSLDNDARCFPDGFPVICFLNGNFYGVFSWQIKKHRDNYMMSKKKTKNIHLDGVIDNASLFGANGDASLIAWTDVPYDTAFEVRNPKPKKKSDGWELTCADGTKYDGDTNMKELIGEDNVGVYDSTNTSHVKTNETKQAILNLSTYITELNQMESASATSEQIKERMAEMFDVESFIDYLIFSDVVTNYDGFRKNWQWITYDGEKWFVEPYDLDGIFGWTSWNPYSPTANRLGNDMNLPSGWFIKYFSSELNTRYAELRNNDIISNDTIIKIFRDWIAAIGTDNYQKNHDMWPNDQEHYYAAPVETHYDSIYRVSNWIDIRITKCDEIYNYNQN